VVYSGYVWFIGSQFNASSLLNMSSVLSDTNNDGYDDTVIFFFPALWNMPDGAVNANDNITLEMITVVADVSTNMENANAKTTSTMIYNTTSYTSTVLITVQVPTLTIIKTAVALTYIDAGTLVNYTVTISNPNPTPVYTLGVSDSLFPILQLMPSLVSTTAGEIIIGDGDGNTTILINRPVLISAQSFVIKYSANLTNIVNSSMTVSNQVFLNYYSTPAASYNINQTHTYSTSTTASIVVATLAVVATIVNTSFGTLLSTYAIRQLTRIIINVIFPQGIIFNAVLKVQLPYTSDKIQTVSS
jgi:hypothetical protein